MDLIEHDGVGDRWATLHVQSFPFIIGDSPEKVSWHCPCGSQLAQDISARQLLNILIKCGRCSRTLQSPARSPGHPIAGMPVYMSPGRTYLIGGQLDVVGKPVMMVGHDALYGYAREVGRSVPDVYEPTHAPGLASLSGPDLAEAAAHLRSLLGADLERLVAADARGRNSPTPPPRRHRLIELAEYLDNASRQITDLSDGVELTLDAELLAEAITARAAALRWSEHSSWPHLRSALVSEAEHTVMMLTVASYLVDANNGVGVYAAQQKQGRAVADMWIEPDLNQRVDLELKTPLALRGPRRPIEPPHAIKVLERALKKSGRQRSNTRTSLLVVGGYHLGESFETVVATARAMLVLERTRYRSLAGVVVADCTYEQSAGPGGQAFTPIARLEVALHPGYSGDLSMRTDVAPTVGFSGSLD